MTLYFSISLLIGLDDYDDDEVPACYSTQMYFDYNALHAIPLIMHNAIKEKGFEFFEGVVQLEPNLPNLKKTTDAAPIARVVFEGQ